VRARWEYQIQPGWPLLSGAQRGERHRGNGRRAPHEAHDRACHREKGVRPVAQALASVRETGYGLVAPEMSEMKLEQPEIVRQGGAFGVKLRASAPSLHMIRVNINTEVSPTVGQRTSVGRTGQLPPKRLRGGSCKPVGEQSLRKVPGRTGARGTRGQAHPNARERPRKAAGYAEQIINEGSGGMICILL
jgi:stage IV sporulation protein A